MRKKLFDKNPRVVLYALQVSVSFGFRPKFAITTMRKKLFDKNPSVALYALQVSVSFGFRPKFAITTMRKTLFDKNPTCSLCIAGECVVWSQAQVCHNHHEKEAV